MVVILKKKFNPQVCIDFRSLNRLIKVSQYPLPGPDELISLLCITGIYTLDLKIGY